MICSLPILSTLLASCAAPLPFATGYVEGEYVLVAPIEASELQSLPVTRGDRVEKGALLARMDHRAAQIALDQAEAALAQARANRADLLEGKRPEEITVIEATLASARAKADEAQHTADRYTRLAETGAATQAQRDDAVTASKVAAAQVREIEANLAVARLPARKPSPPPRPLCRSPNPPATAPRGCWKNATSTPPTPAPSPTSCARSERLVARVLRSWKCCRMVL